MFFGDVVRQKVLLSIFSYILLEFWIKVAGESIFISIYIIMMITKRNKL